MEFTSRPELKGTFGVVSSTHWLASQSGMAVLERGGNAFDAAAAAGFALQVVEPHLNGPGGDLPAIVYSADRGEVRVICAHDPVQFEEWAQRSPEEPLVAAPSGTATV